MGEPRQYNAYLPAGNGKRSGENRSGQQRELGKRTVTDESDQTVVNIAKEEGTKKGLSGIDLNFDI